MFRLCTAQLQRVPFIHTMTHTVALGLGQYSGPASEVVNIIPLVVEKAEFPWLVQASWNFPKLS